MSVWIIVNPRAGGGSAARAGNALKKRLGDAELLATTCPGEAERLTVHAVNSGAETIVAVGGDGTISEVAAGLASGSGRPTPRWAILPAGTGGDYRRTFGWSNSVEEAALRIERGTARLVDVGRATLESHDGTRVTRTFVNVASFGLGGLTDRLVTRTPAWLPGGARFYLGAVRATLSFEPEPVELWLDGKPCVVAPFRNVAICLGGYFGGGMRIAPSADPSDGSFEIVTIEGSKSQTLSLTLDIYRGRHLERDFVHAYRAQRIEARPTGSQEVLVDLDGEQPGRLPLAIELLPRALSLLV